MVVDWPTYFHQQLLEEDCSREHLYDYKPDFNKAILIDSTCTGGTKSSVNEIVMETLLLGADSDGAIQDDNGIFIFQSCEKASHANEGDAHEEQSCDLLEIQDRYEAYFDLSLRKGIKEIVLPCFVAGYDGCETKELAHIALYTARTFLAVNREWNGRIILHFCSQHKNIYHELIQRYFPMQDSSKCPCFKEKNALNNVYSGADTHKLAHHVSGDDDDSMMEDEEADECSSDALFSEFSNSLTSLFEAVGGAELVSAGHQQRKNETRRNSSASIKSF